MVPTESRKHSDLVQHTLDEHRGTMNAVADLEACLDHSPEDRDAWRESLCRCLERLRGVLDEHFRLEETGELFPTLEREHPHFADRVSKLKAEHPRIRRALEAALDRTRDCAFAEVYELRELNAMVQLLVARIRRHEAEENELVMEAYWDETGTGD